MNDLDTNLMALPVNANKDICPACRFKGYHTLDQQQRYHAEKLGEQYKDAPFLACHRGLVNCRLGDIRRV